ncbi:MAG TPA: NAD+ synthase [Candidatus Cloacimonadota bacterium]|nr:NAD+ synthase [Candidatus Cloacimonadota bacterium]HQL14719.1 NAD+ synthase [Candidatus Cloacimonadota bacterium]
MRSFDGEKEKSRIAAFIQGYVHQNGFEKVVIGLSGGIDSSLSAALAVQALGKDMVHGIMLPCKNGNSSSCEDAMLLAKELGISWERIDISSLTDGYFANYAPDASNLRRGNWTARIRMCVLYDLSAKYKALVQGTSNRTELLIGYFTQFGDGACAFEPIGHLYKTEVWQLAKKLSLPERIINKTPSADLWEGQTDEGEIGITYPQLDEILFRLTELQLAPEELIRQGFPSEQVVKVKKMMKQSEFKRKMPPLITDWESGLKNA